MSEYYDNIIFKNMKSHIIGLGIPAESLSVDDFNNYTSLFFFSKDGARYRPNFYTDPESVECGQPFEKLKVEGESQIFMNYIALYPLFQLQMTTFTFVHERFDGPSEHIPAMKRVKEIIQEQSFSANVFALAQEYSNWETDEVI